VLLRSDVTKNCICESREEKEDAIKALRLGKSNTAFKVDDYTDRRESIIFTGRQTSYKNRQIYYNKELELSLARNKEIAQILYPQRDTVSKIIRVEQNITSFDKLRQAIGKRDGEVALGEMLLSKNKPLYDRHKVIMKYANEVDLFSEYETWDDAMFDFGIKGIYEACNSSLELLLDFLREKSKMYGKNKNKGNQKYYMLRKKILFYFSNNIVEKSLNSATKNLYFETLKKIDSMLKVA